MMMSQQDLKKENKELGLFFNEQINDNQDQLLSPSKYGNNSLWAKSCHSSGGSPMK